MDLAKSVGESCKIDAVMLGDRIHGLLAAFGVVVAQSDVALRRTLADLDTHVDLSGGFKELLQALRAIWARLHEAVDACDGLRCQRLRKIIGIGPITADAAVTIIADARL